jgi:hypothetical protein
MIMSAGKLIKNGQASQCGLSIFDVTISGELVNHPPTCKW